MDFSEELPKEEQVYFVEVSVVFWRLLKNNQYRKEKP